MGERRTWWSDATDPDTVARRAAGRRRYNSVRKFRAAYRRAEVSRLVLELMQAYDECESRSRPAAMFGWGIQSEVARRLGVHRSTVSRDVRHGLLGALALRPCWGCGRATRPEDVRELR